MPKLATPITKRKNAERESRRRWKGSCGRPSESCLVSTIPLPSKRIAPHGAEPGDIVHLDGRVLGRHEGVTRYTIGQRRGLNVAVGDPLFVVRIDADRREVIVGPREALMTRALGLKEINWIGGGAFEAAVAAARPVLARVRSTREPVLGRLGVVGGEPGVVFGAPEEGVAPGQACVLYAPEAPSRVLGGGFIAATVRND